VQSSHAGRCSASYSGGASVAARIHALVCARDSASRDLVDLLADTTKSSTDIKPIGGAELQNS
jgi:hypothetical protein